MSHRKGGSVYTIAFTTTSISTAGDVNLFPFQAGSETRVSVDEIYIGALSSNVENLGVAIYRGSTTPLSTGSLVTPVNMGGWDTAGSAGSQVTSPTSSLPSTTSADLLDARTFQDSLYKFCGHGELILVPDQRLDVVMSTPASPTFYGVMRIRELGKNPIS